MKHKKRFKIQHIDWDLLQVDKILALGEKTRKTINGVYEIYKFLEEHSSLKYRETRDVSKVFPNNVVNDELDARLNKRIMYDPNNDTSAIITDEKKFVRDLIENQNHPFVAVEGANQKTSIKK